VRRYPAPAGRGARRPGGRRGGDYILAIVEQTRITNRWRWRQPARRAGTLSAAQALALLEGRDYSTPDDAKRLAVPVFAHRVVINTRNTLVERRLDAGERIIEQFHPGGVPCRDTPL